jgi:ankyrin repeat protein
MKKKHFAVILGLFFLIGSLYADASYRLALVNALVRNDVQRVDTILKENIARMTVADKRLVVNFALTYTYGENTLAVFDLLQKYNIRPDSFDLYTALNRNQPDNVIQLLLRNGAAPNGEILLLAMAKQRLNLATQFIQMGTDVNFFYPLTRENADGMTPLLYASKWNSFELVRLLLERGASINVRATDGNTALSISYTNGNTQIYNFLLENGAIDTWNNIAPASQSSGISSLMDNQALDLQRGTYRLTGGTMTIRFTGTASSGSISYTINGRANTGAYTIAGNNLVITMEGQVFLYRIDTAASFSGNGELWARTGD